MANVEPLNSLWRGAIHEASHAAAVVLHKGTIEGLTLGKHRCHCDAVIPGCASPVRKALINVYADLAGIEGEHLIFGSPPTGGQSDLQAFARHLDQSGLFAGWPVETAHVVFGGLVRDLLRKNDRLVYELANDLLEQGHVYGVDAMARVALSKKMFGVTQSPLMAEDWQDSLATALRRGAAAWTDLTATDRQVARLFGHAMKAADL